MKEKYNIEEVFKSQLEDYEMEVPQQAWANISKQIKSPSPASSLLKTIVANKVASALAIAGILAITGVVINTTTQSDKELVQTEQNTIPHKEKQSISEELSSVEDSHTERNNNSTETPLTKKNPTSKKEKTHDPVIAKEEDQPNEETVYMLSEPTPQDSKPTQEKATENPFITLNKQRTKTIPQSTTNVQVIEVQKENIIATISASPIGGYAPLKVNFSHPYPDAKTIWSFDDGTLSRETETQHIFEYPGEYSVQLIVVSQNGDSSIATKKIQVLSTSKIENIPNIFTPNNDGINDRFVFTHENIQTVEVKIFDKTGNLIFTTNNLEEGWDGNNQFGEPAKEDNYIYIINAIGKDGKTFEEKGVLRLAR